MQFSQIHLSKHVSEILGKDAQKAGLDFAELGLTTWLPRQTSRVADVAGKKTSRPENGVGLWGLGSRWNTERDQKTGSGFGVWGRGGIPNGIRPLIFQPQKGTARDPLLIRWDLCPRRGGSTLGVLVLRHSETAPAEDVATHLNRTLFDEVCLASPARPHLAAMTFLRPGGCAVF